MLHMYIKQRGRESEREREAEKERDRERDDDDDDDDGDDDDNHDDDHDDVFCMSMLLVLDAKSTSSSGCPLCHGGTSRARGYS